MPLATFQLSTLPVVVPSTVPPISTGGFAAGDPAGVRVARERAAYQTRLEHLRVDRIDLG